MNDRGRHRGGLSLDLPDLQKLILAGNRLVLAEALLARNDRLTDHLLDDIKRQPVEVVEDKRCNILPNHHF